MHNDEPHARSIDAGAGLARDDAEALELFTRVEPGRLTRRRQMKKSWLFFLAMFFCNGKMFHGLKESLGPPGK